MDDDTARYLNWIALIAVPFVAGSIASVLALSSVRWGSIWLRGFLGTLALGVILGAAAGFIVDILRPGFVPPATFVLGALEVPLSAVAGLVVARLCAKAWYPPR